MYKVESHIIIDAPAEEVWRVLADFGEVHQWAPSVTNSYSTSERNGGLDASRHCEIQGFGSVEENITEWNEGSDFTYFATGVGPISEGHSTWSVEAVGNKTRV